MTTPATEPLPAERRPRRLPRRQLVLFGALAALLILYIVTIPFRADVWEQIWRQRLNVEWARQQQEEALSQRRLRTHLRRQLRRLVEDPEDFAAVMGAASAHAQLRQYDEALFLLGEGERLRPRDPEVFRAKAEAYLSSGQYDHCIEALERGLALAPDHLDLNILRVDLDAILGWVTESQPRLQRLIDRYGKEEPRVHLLAALVARQVADARGAQEHLREALRLDPKNHKIYGLLSGLEWELGHREEALRLVREGLKLNPNVPDWHIHLGEIQRTLPTRQGYELAERSFRRALALAPESQQAKYGMAMCRLGQGDPQGQVMLERLLRANPYLPAPLRELGNLYMRQGRREEGAVLLARYQEGVHQNDQLKGLSLRMSMQRNRPEPFLDIAELHLRTGFPQKAIVVLRRALRLDPKNPGGRRQLRAALIQAGREGEVEAILARP